MKLIKFAILVIIMMLFVIVGFWPLTTQAQESSSSFVCKPDDFGPLSNKDQWCACAAQNGDIGSLMREGCPQAPRSVSNPSQPAVRCEDLGSTNPAVCKGTLTVYNSCTSRCVNGKKMYFCTATQNPNCTTPEGIGCPAEDSECAPAQAAPTNNATATNNCPPGQVPQAGSDQTTTVCVAQAQAQSSASQATGGSAAASGGGGGNATATGGAGGNAQTGNVTATGGAGGQGGSATVVAAQDTPRVVTAAGVQSRPTVVRLAGAKVGELPKTGLPALAWAALAFIPLGGMLKKYSSNKFKTRNFDEPQLISERRTFQKNS